MAAAGRRDSARALLTRLAEPGQQYVPAYEIAKAYLALGERGPAIDWLERAHRERAHSMAFLAVAPQLDGLGNEPRFGALKLKVGR